MIPELKERETMYRLIVSQLYHDGYQKQAMDLSTTLGLPTNQTPPSDKLYRLVLLAKQHPDQDDLLGNMKGVGGCEPRAAGGGLDLEYDADIVPTSAEPSLYQTSYLSQHKGPCRAVTFNADGTLVATGSVDTSIKVLDVVRMAARAEGGAGGAAGIGKEDGAGEAHPVIRTMYDHMDEVTAVAFHPKALLLASGSADRTIKLFDFAKPSVKRAMRTINEAEPLTSIAFHPCGEYMLVGTHHPTIRLYDAETTQCWTGPVQTDHHTDSLNEVCWSETGRLAATASKDGDVKIWDGVSMRCVQTLRRAHDASPVCSVTFSRNAKYVLTSARDSTVKLWELAASRCLIAYTGAGAAGPQEYPTVARFNHTEDYVMFPDEKSGSMCSWDARNADRKRLLALGHKGAVRAFAHSTTAAACVTGSDDWHVRFWIKHNVA